MNPRLFSHCLMGLLIVIALAGCDNLKVDSASETVRLDREIAAIVNGEAIYRGDLELEAVAQGIIAPGDVFDPTHENHQLILDQLVDQRLLAQEALLRDLDVDPAASHRLRIARERILGNLLVESLVASEVTEDAIQEMYAAQVRLQQLEDEVRISLITVSDEAAANQVVSEFEDGAEFSALAFKYSTDTQTRIEGGDLGYVGAADQPEPFASKIADTPVGEISGAFESETAWHILKVEDRRQSAPQTLEQMRPELVTFLTYAQINKILGELRQNALIEEPRRASSADPQTDTPDTTPAEDTQ